MSKNTSPIQEKASTRASEFPPLGYLGYSLDMSTVTPLNIKTVSQSVKRAVQLIDVDPDDRTREVTIDGVIYKVPRIVGVNEDISSSQGAYITYESGSSANTAFQNDTSLSATYGAIGGSTSVSYAYTKSFTSHNQFALYSLNVDVYGAYLRNYLPYFEERAIKNRLGDLANPFPSSNPSIEVVREYRSFFATYGTHIIINCLYGSRFQLTVHASNEDEEVNKNFSNNVKANYHGIVSSGEFDNTITTTEQYKTYSNFMQKTLAVRGGDMTLGLQIELDADSYEEYKQWVGTAGTNPDIMEFSTIELWNMMKEAGSKEIRDHANACEDAYKWIVLHPQLYQTYVSLSIESDWGEFGLLTPSGVIIRDESKPFDQPDRTMISLTKIMWGKEKSHQHFRMTVHFIVINDGSPIDFYISHGTDGGAGKKGRAMATFQSSTYTNDKVTDNNYNTVWFFQKPVSSIPVPDSRHGHKKDQERTWNEVLDEYLRRLRRGDFIASGLGLEVVDDDVKDESEEV